MNGPWLVKLRWVAIVGQLVTISYVHFGLGVELPFEPLMAALIATAATNLSLDWWVRRSLRTGLNSPNTASIVIASVMTFDLVMLTIMLYLTGGQTNPFLVFYFVNLALAGVLLEPRLAWLLEVAACGGMALLFWHHRSIPVLTDPARLTSVASQQELPLASVGEFVAVVAGSGVIVAFMTRLTSELRASQRAQRHAEEQRARAEKLEALGTLAAGAAHELATPLSTIAVVATEVERELAGRDLPEGIAADLALVRRELERCRSILNRMSLDAGQWIGEALTEMSLADFVDVIVDELASDERVHIDLGDDAEEILLRVPRVALAQALRGLVQNGLDASDHEVTITSERLHAGVRLTFTDRGPGMPPDVLSRAGEPFFTTKQPGQGMGLGLFLARSVVERLDGKLIIESKPNVGTQAIVELPARL